MSTTPIDEYDKLRTRKELAAAVGRSLRSIQYDIEAGFEMPGGLASVNEWREWKRCEMRSVGRGKRGAAGIVIL